MMGLTKYFYKSKQSMAIFSGLTCNQSKRNSTGAIKITENGNQCI